MALWLGGFTVNHFGFSGKQVRKTPILEEKVCVQNHFCFPPRGKGTSKLNIIKKKILIEGSKYVNYIKNILYKKW